MVESAVAHVARLISDPARSRMLLALMGGKALTASELALEADITPQTASSHLTKLVAAELLLVRKQGRHKYFQLHGEDVAELIEHLLAVATKTEPETLDTGPRDPDLRRARVCYDHLAGEFGVLLYDVLVNSGYICERGEVNLSDSGAKFFTGLGADLPTLRNKRRPVCRSCLDWSERRNHLAGSLGQWILNDIFARKWARKDLDSRIVRFTARGLNQFRSRYGLP